MQVEDWFARNKLSQESIDMINHLKKNKPYTDKLIMDAVDTVYNTARNMGISVDEVVNMIVMNELQTLR